MTRAEFINAIKELANKLEKGEIHYINVSENATIFCNQHFGDLFLDIGKGCTMNINLFRASEEEKK